MMRQNGSRPKRNIPRAQWVPKPGNKPPGDGEGRNKAKKSPAGSRPDTASRQESGRPPPLDINLSGKAYPGSVGSLPSRPPAPRSGSDTSSVKGGAPSSTDSVVVSKAKSPKMKFFIGVNPQDTLCLEYGTARSWNVKSSKTVRWNEHSISAMSRDMAVLDILVRESKGRKFMRVLDWFGSPRNLKFAQSVRGCTIEWVCAPNVAIQGDAARTVREVRRNLNEDEEFDVVIIQDVYQFGSRPTDRLGPEAIKEILRCAKASHCYFIGRMFCGVAGADNYGNGKEEMVWHRAGGLIIASPEPRGQLYAPHPDVNWMLDRVQGGIDSSEIGKYGPYTVFRLACSKDGAQTLVHQAPPPAKVVTVVIPGPGFAWPWIRQKIDSLIQRFGCSDTWWGRFLCQKGYLVHLGVYAVLASKFGSKIPNGQIYDAAKHSVEESLARDFEMKCLVTRFPLVFQEIVEGTTSAVLYGTRTDVVRNGLSLRLQHAEVESSLVRMRGTSIKAERGFGFQSALFGVLGAAALGVLSHKTYQVFHQLADGLVVGVAGLVPRGIATCGSADPVANSRSIADLTAAEWVDARGGYRRLYTITAVLEELIGWKFPNLKLGYALLEFFNNAYFEGGYSARWIPLAMHGFNSVLVRRWGKWGLAIAVFLHLSNNVLATDKHFRSLDYPNNPFRVVGTASMQWNWKGVFTSKEKRWSDFKAAYGRGQLVEAGAGVAVPIPPGTTLPPFQSRLEVVDWPLRGRLVIKIDGVIRQPHEALQLLAEDRAENVVYPILATNRLLWAPANTAKNLLVALLTRTHRDPFEGRTDEKERFARWRGVATCMVDAGVFAGNELRQYTVEESAALMGSRGNRILAAHHIDVIEGPLHLKKSVSLKWNETITALKDFGSVVTMKPRPIVNLDPIYHARTAPDARSVTDHLHSIFDGRVFVIGGVKMRIHFASGYNQDKLSLMSADFFTEIACIAASGDDSVAFVPELGYVEADQSQFDQSQDDGPIKVYGFEWMRQAGLSETFISMVYECCTKKYTVKKHRMEVKGTAGTQMPTGITMTTVINTMSTIGMYVYYLVERRKREISVDEAGYELGFTVKSVRRERFGDLTFLKGWWRQEVCGTLTWLPLPSAVLKLGKILRSPIEITKTEKTIRGKRFPVRDDMKTATKKIAHCLARSYGLVPLDYPVFGAFLGALLRLGMDPGRSLGNLEESWKPKIATLTVIDREEAIQAMVYRYDVEAIWIEEVEELFNRLSTLPAYVEHPLFDRLCDVDY